MQVSKLTSYNDSEVVLTLDRNDLLELFTVEACPNCGSEQVIWSHGVTRCPECGAPLAPCSVCTDENGSCNYNSCPYGCDGSENDLKKAVTMPDIFSEDAALLYPFL